MYFSALPSPVLIFTLLIVPTLSAKYPSLEWYTPSLPLPVTVIHQFPVGTWLENLAIRRNGKILTTALSSPEIFQVDRNGVQPVKLVHTFADATGCTGITEMGRDVFYVAAGNFSFSPFRSVPGSWSVYKVDVRHHHPHITKPKPAKVTLVANFPDAILLNGITVLSKWNKWLLISDSGAGVVYRLEVKTGKVVKVLDDLLMQPESDFFANGVNGIKIQDDQLFFTNTNKNLLARIPIQKDGTSRSSATLVTNLDSPDDFTFDDAGKAVVAQIRFDLLASVSVSKNTVVTLAGGPPNGTQGKLFGPTAAQFGRIKPFLDDPSKQDWMKAYVSTNGGLQQYLANNVTRGGTISLVDIRGYL